MPQGDKSAYTDKQKRKAEHIEEGYEDRGVSEKRPSAAPGPPSTRKAAGAKNPALAAVMRRTMPPPKRADAREAPRLLPEPRKSVPLLPKRLQQLANATSTICPSLKPNGAIDNGAARILWRIPDAEKIEEEMVAGRD
jgi:hypothetical protein